MLNAAKSRDGFVTDSLCRRIGADQLGVLLFNRLQLPHQSIVFGVRYLRVVEHVISIVVMPNLIFERIKLIESKRSTLSLQLRARLLQATRLL